MCHMKRPDPKFAPPGRDLPQRTGLGVITETNPIKKQNGLRPGSVHHTQSGDHHAQCALTPDPVFAAIDQHREATAASTMATPSAHV
jgi:hypothetical protein